jgi:hypothetical protein
LDGIDHGVERTSRSGFRDIGGCGDLFDQFSFVHAIPFKLKKLPGFDTRASFARQKNACREKLPARPGHLNV